MRDTVWKGRKQTMNFAEGDEIKFDCSVAVYPVGDDEHAPAEKIVVEKGWVVSAKDPRTAKLIGVAKGMQQVLAERGLWVPKMRGKCGAGIKRHCPDGKCCALGALLACSDFKENHFASGELVTFIRAAGHEALFLPKVSRAKLRRCVTRARTVSL
jgi:hypothetical protein